MDLEYLCVTTDAIFPVCLQDVSILQNKRVPKLMELYWAFLSKRTIELRPMIHLRFFIFIMNRIRCNKKDLTLNFKVKVNFAATFFRSSPIQMCRITI